VSRGFAGAVVAMIAGAGAGAAPAAADPTSGVDGALFRSSYDAGGIFAVEGARLMPKHDLSLKVLLGYARSPLVLAVPGIGDASKDRILDYLVQLDVAFGMSLSERVAIGFDVAGYRTATGPGYGERGRYAQGAVVVRSTGLIALRPLSNIDPSAPPSDGTAYLGDGLAGPLDARAGVKLALDKTPTFAMTAIGSVFLPFGEDEMLLGDRDLVFEPKLAIDWRPDRVHATRLVGNVAARFRRRTALEGYDARDPSQSAADATVLLDVGSELVVGAGGVYELSRRLLAAAEVQAFLPLPSSASWGRCTRYSGKRCSTLRDADYFTDQRYGDLVVLGTLGAMLRVSPDVTANLMVSTGQLGARGSDLQVTAGLTWAPQPAGVAAASRNDRDGDGIPDSVDACPDEPEDKDGFQDEDGCPDPDNDGDGIPDAVDRCPNDPDDKDGFEDEDGCPDDDNDGDGIPDVVDRCPNEPEDKDGFEDEDGCPDLDNDGDGIPDAVDRCPNDPETFNGVDDDDGCPDVRPTIGPEERADRIDLKGAPITFAKGTAALTAAAKQQLDQLAQLIKARRLTIRVEVHVPLGTKATGAAAIATQRKKDKLIAQVRARSIVEYLTAQGVPAQQLQGVGVGSERPLAGAAPTDGANERVDFIKAGVSGRINEPVDFIRGGNP
jgi:outer membrane protein OmpA-like peptidoglycan-associated protein